MFFLKMVSVILDITTMYVQVFRAIKMERNVVTDS